MINGCRPKYPFSAEGDETEPGFTARDPLTWADEAMPSSLIRRRFADGSVSCETDSLGTAGTDFRGSGGLNGLKGILFTTCPIDLPHRGKKARGKKKRRER